MTQKYQVKVSMKQAAIVETGIVLKQGDFGMQIEIEVLDFDATGTTPQIVFRKAMGAVESTTITVSGNKYTYTFKGTELDTPGKCFCDLKLKNSTTQRISTASFMFKVVADTLDGLAEESSSYSDTIEQLMEDCLHKSETAGLVKNDGSINATIEADVTNLKKYTLQGSNTNIVESTKQAICEGTCDKIPTNRLYGVSGDCTLTNAPFSESHYTIITLEKNGDVQSNGSVQIAQLTSTGQIKKRNLSNGSWLAWETIIKDSELEIAVQGSRTNITDSNKQAICEGSCDNLPNNKIYGIDGNATLINKPIASQFFVMVTIGKNISRSTADMQLAYNRNIPRIILYRVYTGSAWTTWEPIETSHDVREEIASVNPENKDLYLVNYTVADGAYNVSTKSYTTGNTVYKHSEYTLQGEKILLVAGYAYSANYPAWCILDSNGDIIDQYSKYSEVGEPHSVTEVVKIPANANKIIVNYRKETDTAKDSNPMFICGYSQQKIFSPEIKDNFVDAGGKIVFGKCMRTNLTEAANDLHVYRELVVSGGEEVYITGYNYTINFPFVMLLDANGDVIYIPSGYADQQSIYNQKIVLPSTAKKIIVNGKMDTKILPTVYKAVNIKSDLSALKNQDIRKENVQLESIYPTVSYGYVKNKDGSMSTQNDVYVMCEATITPGNTYYVSGNHFSDNWPTYLFENANGDICDIAFGPEFVTGGKYFDIKVIAPADAVKLYVNARTVSDFDIKVQKSGNLADSLKFGCEIGLYDGRTPVMEITSDYVSDEWVTNATKEERNLSRFSYAYAMMLHRIMTTYPLATVICCSCNECERKLFELGFPERNDYGETITDFNNVIEKLCKAFGALYVDHHSCGITYYNFENYVCDYNPTTKFGLHPNAAGMELIAQKTIHDLYGLDFAGKKLSVFGDSISTYYGTGSEHNMYPYGDVDDVSKTWWYISMIEHFGMTLLNNGSGGSRSVTTTREGIATYPKSGCNQDAIDNLAVGGVSPDVIIIKQGINDFGNTGSSTNKNLNGHYYFGGL